MAQIKQLYPTHVITFTPITATNQVPDIWASCVAESNLIFSGKPNTTVSGQPRGIRLSAADFAAIDSMMSDFLAPQVYAFICNKMKEWERDVASARRGISGRLFKVGLKYFGSSKPTNVPTYFIDPTTQLTIFPFASPEMIMRKLGDFAFMIRDYKYAQSVYESVKKDFSTSEKFVKFFAGAQEMISITNLIQADGGRTNYESSYDAACQMYQDVKLPLYAVRVSIWVSEVIKGFGAYGEAAHALSRMANDVRFQSLTKGK